MNRYSLSVRAPYRKGFGDVTIVSITEDLVKLSKEFGGHSDLSSQTTSGSYEWRYVDLVDQEHLLEGKVAELEKKYGSEFVRFTLAEYTPKA
jgi:hypothetical protein